MCKKIFSIITVCKNEEKHISDTLDSILLQNKDLYELIIIDGESTDNTIEIIHKYEDIFKDRGIEYTFESRKDNGIYYGMNRGIEYAKYKYCIFLNAADEFYNANVLQNVAKILEHKSPDVLYGDDLKLDEENSSSYVFKTNHKDLMWGCFICHQSAFIKTSLLKARNYRTDLCLSSDYEYWLYLYTNGYSFEHVNMIVSIFRLGGSSSIQYRKSQSETDDLIEEYRASLGMSPFCNKKHRFSFSLKERNYNKGCGWSLPEEHGTWAVGNQSDFFVFCKKNTTYYFRMCIIADFGYSRQIYVNGEYISNVVFKDNEYIAVLDKKFIIDGYNTISIKTIENVPYIDDAYGISRDHRRCNLHVKKIICSRSRFFALFDIEHYINKLVGKMKSLWRRIRKYL